MALVLMNEREVKHTWSDYNKGVEVGILRVTGHVNSDVVVRETRQ